jgi:hypothetical protein
VHEVGERAATASSNGGKWDHLTTVFWNLNAPPPRLDPEDGDGVVASGPGTVEYTTDETSDGSRDGCPTHAHGSAKDSMRVVLEVGWASVGSDRGIDLHLLETKGSWGPGLFSIPVTYESACSQPQVAPVTPDVPDYFPVDPRRFVEVDGEAIRGRSVVVTRCNDWVKALAREQCDPDEWSTFTITAEISLARVYSKTAPCAVPLLYGFTIESAKILLRRKNCTLGKVGYAYSIERKGRIVAQKPQYKSRLKNGAAVSVTVSKGRKKR